MGYSPQGCKESDTTEQLHRQKADQKVRIELEAGNWENSSEAGVAKLGRGHALPPHLTYCISPNPFISISLHKYRVIRDYHSTNKYTEGQRGNY